MSTVLSNETINLEDSSKPQLASKKELKDAYSLILESLHAGKKIILITADEGKGKTALLHTISKDIASNNRIISICGKDLPTSNPSNTDVKIPELDHMRDFIIESCKLKEKLIVTLDDANYLPLNFLVTLITHINDTKSSGHNFQLILSGPAIFKDQLLTITTLNEDTFTHCPMAGLSDSEVSRYIKNKTYRISSNIKNLEFEPTALHMLHEFAKSDKQVLDVLLEWCSAIAKKDQLSTIASDTVHRAANFAKQFSKDKNLRLANSYPPSHEVYKYINTLQSDNKTSKKISSSESKNINVTSERNIPTIHSKIEEVIDKNESSNTTEKNSLEKHKPLPFKIKELEVIDDDVMQPQWVPTAKKISNNKKHLFIQVGVLATLVLAFIFFISNRIGTEPVIDDSATTQIAEKDLQQPHIVEKSLLKDDVTPNLAAKKDVIHKPSVAPLVLGSLDKTLLGDETTSIKIQNERIKSASEINRLLGLAEKQFLNKKLSTPVGDNALETYRMVLASEPDNKKALDGITKVHDKYLNWASYYSKRNDTKRAKLFYRKSLQINPNNNIALEGLQNIERKQTSNVLVEPKPTIQNESQNNISSKEIQTLLLTANEKMSQIIIGINSNERNYKNYQEAHVAYQNIIRHQPQNQEAIQGLSTLMSYYVDWAELQIKGRNYNIALFLYGQALSIDPNNEQLSKRIEQVREIKNSL